ncbi:six-hairpin glycosidase [Lucifera butyrica]|uniref:Six-hairpin glycosidase n=1 Tax=Lucifera butyrica TaxID=1351585 RepID=A0A498R3Q5_9FIRM|nr:thioredoxin domain-containing protein [Lucifera butyrica]VBB05775.1 six-hairpin glycosidase [Lucifera butyrica]
MEKRPNQLIKEKSPYLLQHAYNPVDWHPWSGEAFEKAEKENKPIFLSIGYSTCHWCHVMERESFEDQAVAEILNQYYVAVKVDREERPDVDHIYMSVCQAMTGQGGWPLTVVMTPDKTPFFAGTYFPKISKWGRPGLVDILQAIHKQWMTNREDLIESGRQVAHAVRCNEAAVPAGALSTAMLDTAFRQLESDFDPVYGGFGGAPKFPLPHNLLFLLRYWYRTGRKSALSMVEKTLFSMHNGGIYDHLGFGFARYSTDAKWLVPHFEKMLYDNALLCYAFLEAYQATDNVLLSQVAEEILSYVLRDMTEGAGGFYSAQDADSEGVEGKFYVWTYEEILSVLGPEQGPVFAGFYGTAVQGNFEQGLNILNRIHNNLEEYAAKQGLSKEELQKTIAQGREKLFSVREKRIHPHKDDKILTAWNGLMIAALAKAGQVLDNPEYTEAAETALGFIWTRLRREDGRLLARFREGEAAYPAYLDDYAFLLWALLELYSATFAVKYIRQGMELSREMKRLFWDSQHGGFYFYGIDGEPLLSRPKEVYDGALPSGNSVAIWGLLKLARLTGDSETGELAEQSLAAFSGEVSRYPKAYSFYLLGLDYYLSPPRHIVIAGAAEEGTKAMLTALSRTYLPDTDILFNNSQLQDESGTALPLLNGKEALQGKATAYVCRDFACQAPVTDMNALLQSLED